MIEISHRSKSFVAVMDEAIALVKEQLNVPDTRGTLLQGGASMQFAMLAFNFLSEKGWDSTWIRVLGLQKPTKKQPV